MKWLGLGLVAIGMGLAVGLGNYESDAVIFMVLIPISFFMAISD